MKQDRRGSWYLLTGVVLGIAAGLFYSWVISPVKYVDAPPYALRADFKDDYRALVAASYLFSGDILRAKNRLAQLKDDEIARSLVMQAQRALAEGRPEGEVWALENLAMALSEDVTPTLSTTSPTGSSPDEPPANEVVSTPTYGSYQLVENRLICNPGQTDPMIQVEVQDNLAQPVAGIKLVVTWDEAEDHIFTGLKPELGSGYADFIMKPGVIYDLRLAAGGQDVQDLIAAECVMDDGSRYWGSWRLTFIQP